MERYRKLTSKRYPDVVMKVIPGHFVTPNSHINYYIDMTTMKTRQNEAEAAAAALAENYAATTIVDTIVCMDGVEVIGAYLAQQLTRNGVLSKNAHKTIYVMTPEYNLSGQMIFRENTQMMVQEKNCLLLAASITTGATVARAVEAIRYYGGMVSGVSAIFSAATKLSTLHIFSLFTTKDIPDYQSWKADHCALCARKIPVDAIANGFGYSRLT